VISPRSTSVRFGLATFAAAFVAAICGSRAGAGASDWVADLAPAGSCASSEDAAAPGGVKRKAIVCLANWARRRHGLRALAPSRPLRQAATEKGRRVAYCRELSHAPCGSDPFEEVRATGFPYSIFGENIWAGPWGVSAREVVAGWLASPPHRANLLRRGFHLFGAGLVHAPGFLGNPDGAVWVATFASRRS
jgi:uncharacterized protein YkwD